MGKNVPDSFDLQWKERMLRDWVYTAVYVQSSYL